MAQINKIRESFNISDLTNMQEVFNIFDREESGILDMPEIDTIMQTLGYKVTTTEIQNIIAELGKEHNAITFDDFLEIVYKLLGYEDDEELRDTFQLFDSDQDGFIKASDIKQIMLNIGEKLTDEEIDEMVREADIDGDGLICYDEFLILMK